MSKKENGTVEVTVNISSITKGLIIIGFIIFLISYLDYSSIPIIKIINTQFKDILKNIGLTGISAGFVSVIVEISSIKNVVNKSIMKIVSGNFPFDNFSVERLNELHQQIVVKRSESEKMSLSMINNSAYSLEKELLNTANDLYYEYNKANFLIEHKNNVFKKKAEYDYQIINRFGKENKVLFTISVIHPSDSITKEELLKIVNIEKFTITSSEKKNGGECIDLSEKANEFINIISTEKQMHSLYKYEIKFEYPLTKCYSNRIKMIYTYEVPDYDIIQSYKTNHSCKMMEHTLIIRGENETWELAGDAYTAFYFPPTDKEYGVKQSVSNVISVHFGDWSLPGAGYMVTFLKK